MALTYIGTKFKNIQCHCLYGFRGNFQYQEVLFVCEKNDNHNLTSNRFLNSS